MSGYSCQLHVEFAPTRETLEPLLLSCCPLPSPYVSRVEVIYPRDAQLGSKVKPVFQVTEALLSRGNVYVCAEGYLGCRGRGRLECGDGLEPATWVYTWAEPRSGLADVASSLHCFQTTMTAYRTSLSLSCTTGLDYLMCRWGPQGH